MGETKLRLVSRSAQ